MVYGAISRLGQIPYLLRVRLFSMPRIPEKLSTTNCFSILVTGLRCFIKNLDALRENI